MPWHQTVGLKPHGGGAFGPAVANLPPGPLLALDSLQTLDMTVPPPADSPVAHDVFRDGLGDRVSIPGQGGRRFEVLRVRVALAATEGFEPALQAQAAALSGFADLSFAAVHRVDRVRPGSGVLAVLAERPAGIRLSVLLDRARSGALETTPRIAIAALRQLAPALVRLHEYAPGVSHGALAPERVVVAPNGHLQVTDVAFGAVIERLNLSRLELWRAFRIAAPPAAGPVRLNDRADLMQLGMLALALLAGRPIEPDEFPGGVAALTRETIDGWAARKRPVPHAIAAWLPRALQLDPRRSYPTMGAALAALAGTPAWRIDEASARHALTAWSTGKTVARIARRGQGIQPTSPNPSPITAAGSGGAARPRPQSVAEPPQATSGPIRPRACRAEPAAAPPPRPQPRCANPAPPPPARRQSWSWLLAAMLTVVSVGAIAVAGTERFGSGAPRRGALALQSSPSGVDVFVDGLPRGVTPVDLRLTPGSHIVELRGRGAPLVLPIKIAAGERFHQQVAFDAKSREGQVGQIAVRSTPPGARVTVDGEPRGVAPITILGLPAGRHLVEVAQNGRVERHQVRVQVGTMVTLETPGWSPATGWLVTEAPFDVEVRADGRSLGVMRNRRIALAPGRHAIEIVNDTLGLHETRDVAIRSGEPTPLVVQAPSGTVHLNAKPWAEVWLDGQRIGETPIGSLAVPIGAHEFVFNHPEFGERSHAVSVTLTAPVHLTVDMRP